MITARPELSYWIVLESLVVTVGQEFRNKCWELRNSLTKLTIIIRKLYNNINQERCAVDYIFKLQFTELKTDQYVGKCSDCSSSISRAILNFWIIKERVGRDGERRLGKLTCLFSREERREERDLNNVTFHQEIIIARNVDADIWSAGGWWETILMKWFNKNWTFYNLQVSCFLAGYQFNIFVLRTYLYN